MKAVMPQSALREIVHKDFARRKIAIHDYLRNKRYLIVLLRCLYKRCVGLSWRSTSRSSEGKQGFGNAHLYG
ncbi:hypothetical protein WN943_023709 [Citrus x changshan-huyou]